jgi:hypothetical protein
LSFAALGVVVEFAVSGCPVFVRSVVEELTDFGCASPRKMDGEEGTDIAVAALAVWLDRAASEDLVRQNGELPSALGDAG